MNGDSEKNSPECQIFKHARVVRYLRPFASGFDQKSPPSLHQRAIVSSPNVIEIMCWVIRAAFGYFPWLITTPLAHRPTQLSHTRIQHATANVDKRATLRTANDFMTTYEPRAGSSRLHRSSGGVSTTSKTLRTAHATLSVCTDAGPLNPQRESSRGKPGKAFMWGERHVTVWVRPRTVAGRTNISLHEAHAYKSQLTLQRFMRANPNLRAKESHLMCTRKLWHACNSLEGKQATHSSFHCGS